MVNILNLNGEDEKQSSLPTSTFQDTDVFQSQTSTLSSTSEEDQQTFLNSLSDADYKKMGEYHSQWYSFDQAKNMLTSDKQYQQNYLNNLSDEQYNQMRDYYNQWYSFEEAQNKLQGIGQNTTSQINWWWIRWQINRAWEDKGIFWTFIDNVADGFNQVGNTFEWIDEKVNELIPTFSTEKRKQELKEKVNNLPKEKQQEYIDTYNNSKTLQKLYANAYEYMLVKEWGFLDELLDANKTEDVWPNVWVMFANAPWSLAKLWTAIARAWTNPYDTAMWLWELFWTSEWREILADEYLTSEWWKRRMEEDPVWVASDIYAVWSLWAWAWKLALQWWAKLGSRLWQDVAKLSTKADKLWTLAEKLDTISDLWITKWINKALDVGLEYAWKSGSKAVRTLWNAVELSQRPLRFVGKHIGEIKSIFKEGSKLLNWKNNQKVEVTPWATEVANKVKEGFFTKVKNNFSSWLWADNRLKMYSNRYFAPIAKRVLNDIDTNGAPMRESQIGAKYYNELADNLIKTIDTYAENLEETGKIYEQLRNSWIRADLSPVQMNIRKYLRENGVNPVLWENGKYELRFAKDSRLLPIEQNQIKMAFDWIMNTNLRSADFDTFHGLRKDIDKKLVKWDNAWRQEQQEIVKGMRKIMNEEAHAKFPWFDKADNLYHREINELENLKYNLVYRGWPKKGEYKDNVGQHLKTIINTNKDGMRDRLQKIVPDIAEMSEAIELATKYGKAYQGSPALMKVLWKIGGAIAWIPTWNLWGFIAWWIIDEFVTKKLGEKMRKKVLQEIADNIPEDMQKELADIFIRDASWWELFEGEKQLRDQAVQEIAEAVSKITGEEKPESFKSKAEKQAETKPLEDKPSNEVKEEVQAVWDFVNEMNQTTTTNKLADTIDYSRMSDEGLNALLEEKNLPKQERKTIEDILERRMQKEMQREAERGEKASQFWVKDEVEFVRRAHQLQEMEKNIGKVGGKKVKDSTFKENQRKEREKKREKLIEEIWETYGIDQFEAYNRYLEYENAGVEGEQYTQRVGTKKKNDYDTEVQELLNKKKEEWSKQPQHIREMDDYEKQVRQDLIDSRGDGYEVRERDGGDAFIKNGDIIGRWNYKDGQISEIIFSTDDGFDAIMNNKRFLRNLPDDTVIHKQGEELSATAKELRDVKYGNEEKGKTMYQMAYHGWPNSFDRFDLSHLWEGEGTQMRGYWHYVTLDEKVAKWYAEHTTKNNKPEEYRLVEDKMKQWESFEEARQEVIEEIQSDIDEFWDQSSEYVKNMKRQIEKLENMKEEDLSNKTSKNLYTIDIPDEVKTKTPTGKNYLDYDKKITPTQFEKMKKTLWEYTDGALQGRYQYDLDYYRWQWQWSWKWWDLYDWISGLLWSDKKASEFLNSLWYDGIKYDWWVDWPCAVLFTDEAMNIVNHEKYQIADQTKTPEFKKRFKESKVVDENGNPLVVYHGTANQFTAFSKEMIWSNFNQDIQWFFFTDSKNSAEDYANTTSYWLPRSQKWNVMEVYLSIQNPLIKKIDYDPIELRDNNHERFIKEANNKWADGIIIKAYKWESMYIPFNPNQIKSATDNIWTFDLNNPDIRYQKFWVAKQGEKGITAQEGLGMKNFKNERSVEEIAKHYGIETKIVDQILTPNGDKALWSYGDRLIKLAKDLKESTVPHELLHATFDMVDTQTKQKILDVVKKKLEREWKMEGIKDKDLNAEERLADSFSEYFRTGKFEDRTRPKGVMNKIKEFFKRVKDFITGVYKERNQIKKLFDDILEEKIKVEKSTSQTQYQSAWDIYSKNFKNRFGDWENDPESASKVVDPYSWEPLAVYHGTKIAWFTQFNRADNGIRFSKDIDVADTYASDSYAWERAPIVKGDAYIEDFVGEWDNGIYKVYLDIKKPLVLDYEWYWALNHPELAEPSYYLENLWDEYDWIIAMNIRDEHVHEWWLNNPEERYAENVVYWVKNPNQIKSATDNNGNFSKTDDDIRHQMAYHGSKADFDKFDSSHIGEGQGAQVHWRGHYVTTDPENAKFYAKDNLMFKGVQTHQLDSLQDLPPEWHAVITNIEELYNDGYGTIQDCIENNQRVYDREVKRLQEEVKQDDNSYTRGLLERTEKRKEVADSLKPEDFKIPNRNFYEIDIPDPIKTDTPTWSNYLDENKKITPKQYEKFKISLKDYIKENNLPSRSLDVKYEDLTSRGKAWVGGGWSAIYDVIETILWSDKKASEFLNELWYDGIKYKDGRDWDSYVIFNDDKMNIKSHEKFQLWDGKPMSHSEKQSMINDIKKREKIMDSGNITRHKKFKLLMKNNYDSKEIREKTWDSSYKQSTDVRKNQFALEEMALKWPQVIKRDNSTVDRYGNKKKPWPYLEYLWNVWYHVSYPVWNKAQKLKHQMKKNNK